MEIFVVCNPMRLLVWQKNKTDIQPKSYLPVVVVDNERSPRLKTKNSANTNLVAMLQVKPIKLDGSKIHSRQVSP